MKRLVRNICLWTGMLLSTGILAQESYTLNLEFNREDFRILHNRGDAVIVEALDEAYYYADGSGAHALPLTTVRMLVPNGAEFSGLECSSKMSLISESVVLKQLPALQPTSAKYKASLDGSDQDPAEGSFPEQEITYTGTGIQRGYTWFCFQISPFVYTESEKSLSLITHLRIQVNYRVNPAFFSRISPTPELIQQVEATTLNPEDLFAFYPASEAYHLKSTGSRVDYLLVTAEALKEEFQALIDWKVRKGLKAEIITLEEIYSSYEGPSDQLKIKNCLLDYYDNSQLKWALLAGDHEVVPSQGCYGEVNANDFTLEDWNIPTDLFYACFDKRFDWNSNVNDKIGETHLDGIDLFPEISISRIPVKDPRQAREFVQKTLRYEQAPPREDFAELMLLTGTKSWNTWEGKSDNHHRSDFMFSKFVEENWVGEKVAFYDTGTDFESDEGYHLSAANLTEQLNQGYGFFHYSGHANTQSIAMETGPAFSTVHATELRNQESGIMFSTSCDLNAYDSIDPCLSESFLRNPDGGCVGFFGSTRYGFGYPDTLLHLGPSYNYSSSFLKYIFGEEAGSASPALGDVASRAKSDFIFSSSAGGAYYFLLYAINVMGDPELPILTENPSTFDNVRLYRLGDALTINTGGVQNCRICITSEDLSEGYQEMVEGLSHFTFEDIPEHFQVCITAPNYTPYRFFSGTLTGLGHSSEAYFRVYPNPFTDVVQYEMDQPPSRIQVYDAHGKLVLEDSSGFRSGSLDLSAYPGGMYVLKIRSGQRIRHFKLLKR